MIKCADGCVYSRAIDQPYPRLCVHCRTPEPTEIAKPDSIDQLRKENDELRVQIVQLKLQRAQLAEQLDHVKPTAALNHPAHVEARERAALHALRTVRDLLDPIIETLSKRPGEL